MILPKDLLWLLLLPYCHVSKALEADSFLALDAQGYFSGCQWTYLNNRVIEFPIALPTICWWAI